MLTRWFAHLNTHPRNRDAIVAGMWLVLGLAFLQFRAYPLWGATAVWTTSGSVFLWTLLVLAVLATQRSTRPLLVLSAGVVVIAVDIAFGGSLGAVLVFTDLIYAAFKYGSDRAVRAMIWVFVAVAAVTALAIVVWPPDDWRVSLLFAQWGAIVLISATWGWNVRSERLRTRAAMAAEHSQAVQRLRRKIAHDLHDLVANQIAGTGLHVEAAKLHVGHLPAPDPEILRSLDRAANSATEADRQLRRMIAILSAVEDLEEPTTLPTRELVDTAVSELDIGVPAPRTLVWAGSGREGLRTRLAAEPTPTVQVCLRVLRELVANAVKHGQGDVEVRVAAEPNFSLTVTNAIASGPRAARGSGIGISGAALLLEGTGAALEAGATDEKRWRATLVLAAPVAAQTAAEGAHS